MDWLSLSFPIPDPNELYSTKHQQPQVNNNLESRYLESLYFSLPDSNGKRKHPTLVPNHSKKPQKVIMLIMLISVCCLNDQTSLQEGQPISFNEEG